MRKITTRQAINETLSYQMEKDDNVFMMGEDIAFYGGSLKVTAGMFDRFGGERVRDTPLSESAIIGAGVGAAMMGMRPVVELTYIDFSFVSMDQILNQAAKWQYMTAGNIKIPLVIRTQGGGYRGNGSQHSQSLEAFFTHIPGLVVCMPSTPFDFAGLLNSAVEDDNPVMFIEHKLLYNVRGAFPDKGEQVRIPFGCADIKRAGSDITIVAYSYMVHKTLAAARLLEEQGISAEVIDPRTLNPLDYDTIMQSVEKTGRAMVVAEAHENGSFAKQIAHRISEEHFGRLKAPVKCVGALNVPIPYAKSLEDHMLPDEGNIVACAKEIMAYGQAAG